MKRIEVVIHPEKFEPVRQTLEKAGCLEVMVVGLDQGGRSRQPAFSWKLWDSQKAAFSRVKLEILAAPFFAPQVVKAILEGSSEGRWGQGRIRIEEISDTEPH